LSEGQGCLKVKVVWHSTRFITRLFSTLLFTRLFSTRFITRLFSTRFITRHFSRLGPRVTHSTGFSHWASFVII